MKPETKETIKDAAFVAALLLITYVSLILVGTF